MEKMIPVCTSHCVEAQTHHHPPPIPALIFLNPIQQVAEDPPTTWSTAYLSPVGRISPPCAFLTPHCSPRGTQVFESVCSSICLPVSFPFEMEGYVPCDFLRILRRACGANTPSDASCFSSDVAPGVLDGLVILRSDSSLMAAYSHSQSLFTSVAV